MNLLNDDKITPPPGIVSSIKSGLDISANHIAIILFPVLLDLFLWLGPQLRIATSLWDSIEKLNTYTIDGIIPSENVQNIQTFLDGLNVASINLFNRLRTFPFGISSLMGQIFPMSTPLGETTAYEIESSFIFFLAAVGLTLIGWLLGGLYFTWVAKITFQNEKQDFIWAVKAILQTALLSIFWLIVIITFGLPLLLFFLIFLQINASLAQFALIFLAFFAMWIVVPVFFSPHGIFTKQENLFHSILSSFHLSRYTLPISGFFVISVIVLSIGFNILWLTPSPSSWMMLVGILGHAFITTSLLSASFIYYRDMQIWLEGVLKVLNSKTTSAKAESP